MNSRVGLIRGTLRPSMGSSAQYKGLISSSAPAPNSRNRIPSSITLKRGATR